MHQTNFHFKLPMHSGEAIMLSIALALKFPKCSRIFILRKCSQQETLSYALKQLYTMQDSPQTSVVTFALGFVTLTPNCFALAMISMRFLDETAWAILDHRSVYSIAIGADTTHSAA